MRKKRLKSVIDHYLPAILCKLQKFPFLPEKLILVIDILFVSFSIFFAYYIRFALLNDLAAFDKILWKLLVSVVVSGFFFLLFNTYSEFVRFSTFRNIMRIVLSLFCTFIFLQLCLWIFPVATSYSQYSEVGIIIAFLMSVCSILFFRIIVRVFYDYTLRNGVKGKQIPMLIFGIEAIHIGVAKMIRLDEKFPYSIAGFISPDPLPSRFRLLGSRVYSPEDVLNTIITSKGIKAILVHKEDLHSEKKKALFRRFTERKIELLAMPSVENLNDIRQIKKIDIEDLLGRNPIKTDLTLISSNMKGKTVLVTGAAGSIGSEIVRQLCQFDLHRLLLVDCAESPLYQLALELSDNTKTPFTPLVADVRHKNTMKRIFEKYLPDYVFHAAAYKHVPLMEQHPREAIFTNVFGTKNVADLAVAYYAECFVMISTDKAVNPGNVMGASKRIAEMYVQSLSTALKYSKSISNSTQRFITTRFGNVLGSNGSVITRFARQIMEGGPVTVTDPNIIRYFMTIPEACSLVLEAGMLGNGGEVFVFDMGDSVKIKDLAEEMIRLSGLEPYKDINIVYTGLRPGEKLHEELLYDKEIKETMQNRKIMIGNVREYDFRQVCSWLEKLLQAAKNEDETEIVRVMKEIVPEFVSANSIFGELDKFECRV